MTTNYVIYKNQGCVNAFGVSFCETIYSATLLAATDTALAVPLTAAMGAPAANVNNKFLAVICCTPADLVFMALNEAAGLPGGAAFTAATSELIPNGYIAKVVKSGDVIHFYSPSTPDITVAFYAIQE